MFPSIVAFVISLDRTPERWLATKAECERVGLPAEKILAMEPQEAAGWLPNSEWSGGILGICASSDYAISLMAEREEDWILLLEDDARFNLRFRNIETLYKMISKVPNTVGALHIGFMTGNEIWWDQFSPLGRLRLFLRPRARIHATRRHFTTPRGYLKEFPPAPPVAWGSHALLIRRELAHEVREAMATFDLPQDWKLNHCLHAFPELFVRPRAPFVTQRRVKSVRQEIDRLNL